MTTSDRSSAVPGSAANEQVGDAASPPTCQFPMCFDDGPCTLDCPGQKPAVPPNVEDMQTVGRPIRHWWVEVSGFAGRFCGTCGVDEDDLDDERRRSCVLY